MHLKPGSKIIKAKPTSLPTILYNEQHPNGYKFDAMKDDIDSLMRSGWADTPALLFRNVQVVGTDAIVDAAVQKEKQRLTDEAGDGSPPDEPEISDLENIFAIDPEGLVKDDLVRLGSHYGIKLSLSKKEATMVKEIQAHLQESNSD